MVQLGKISFKKGVDVDPNLYIGVDVGNKGRTESRTAQEWGMVESNQDLKSIKEVFFLSLLLVFELTYIFFLFSLFSFLFSLFSFLFSLFSFLFSLFSFYFSYRLKKTTKGHFSTHKSSETE